MSSVDNNNSILNKLFSPTCSTSNIGSKYTRHFGQNNISVQKNIFIRKLFEGKLFCGDDNQNLTDVGCMAKLNSWISARPGHTSLMRQSVVISAC